MSSLNARRRVALRGATRADRIEQQLDRALEQLAQERRRVGELLTERTHLVRAMGTLWADRERALGREVSDV